MICAKCGTEDRIGGKYCGRCGAILIAENNCDASDAIEIVKNHEMPIAISVSSLSAGGMLGDADLYYNDARRYYEGTNGAADITKAVQCLLEAAKLGHAMAQYRLAGILARGYDTEAPNFRGAVYWYDKASDSVADAAFCAGRIYDLGAGDVEKNIEKMISYYKKAADMKHSSAIFNLGTMYWNGEYFERNRDKGIEMFKEAAKLGCQEAVEALNRILNNV